MALYDPTEPETSIDLIAEALLSNTRTFYCHFFNECGKKPIRYVTYQGKEIGVCVEHYNEIKNS